MEGEEFHKTKNESVLVATDRRATGRSSKPEANLRSHVDAARCGQLGSAVGCADTPNGPGETRPGHTTQDLGWTVMMTTAAGTVSDVFRYVPQPVK